MEKLRASFEGKGWTWATMMLGEQTPALLLIPPKAVADRDIAKLVADVNAGKFGKLSGGYGELGSPNDQNGTTAL